TKQPTDGIPSPMGSVEFGGTYSFSVEVEGGVEPLTYEWFHNGELLENNTRISGADTATLTINSAEPTDSGEYYVEIKDAASGSVRSANDRLLALAEHEVILAGKDLPDSAIDVVW